MTTYRYEPVWDPSVPPGGFVCNFCAMPVESEPCEDHAPAVDEPFPCGHEMRTRGCGGCDPGAIDFVIEEGGTWRPFDPARDLLQPASEAKP